MIDARTALFARWLARNGASSIAIWLSLEDVVQRTSVDHDAALLLGKTDQLTPPLSRASAPIEANGLCDDELFVMLLDFRV